MHKPAHTSLHLAPVPPLDGDPYDALLTPQVFSRPRARTCGLDDIVATAQPQSADGDSNATRTAHQSDIGDILIHITNVCANPAMDSHVASPHRARYRLSPNAQIPHDNSITATHRQAADCAALAHHRHRHAPGAHSESGVRTWRASNHQPAGLFIPSPASLDDGGG
jgi:hypothetical protein